MKIQTFLEKKSGTSSTVVFNLTTLKTYKCENDQNDCHGHWLLPSGLFWRLQLLAKSMNVDYSADDPS